MIKGSSVLVAVAVLGFAGLGGCGKKQDAGEKAADDYVSKSAKADLAELKTAIASGKPSDGTYKCAHMANIDVLRRADKATATELEGLCTKDLWVAIMKVEVEKAEAARKQKPDEQVLSECYNGVYENAKDELVKAKTADAAKDLVARFDAVCPPKK